MNTQREMRDLIGGLVSCVEKLKESASSKWSSTCGSSPETEKKIVSPQLSGSNVKVFNANKCSITEASCTNHDNLDENEQFLPNMKLVTTCGVAYILIRSGK